MVRSKYILFAIFLLSAVGVSAQKAERDYIRKGNRLFNDFGNKSQVDGIHV